ncbi:MAG: type II toxin-antitoxin system RelE family toxin [Thermoanaerobaculia bacterium]
MPDYRIFETRAFQKDLEGLGPAAARRIRATLDARVYPILRATPRSVPSGARLRDWEPPTWRIRVGSWRIFFEIDDAERIVFLTAADHRKDAYR